MRAYLRLDPLIDERKQHYTPAQLGTYVKVLATAMRQTDRGRFRSVAALKRAMPPSFARHIDFLLAEGDLSVGPDEKVYVEGWDDWQEGDMTVNERMSRLRNKRNFSTATSVTNSKTPMPTLEVDVLDVGDAREDIAAYVEVTGRWPTPRQLGVLDDALAQHDVTGAKWAADLIRANPGNPIGAVLDAQKAYRAERKAGAEAQEQESAKRRPGLRDPLLQEIARTMAEREAAPA